MGTVGVEPTRASATAGAAEARRARLGHGECGEAKGGPIKDERGASSTGTVLDSPPAVKSSRAVR